MSNNYKVGIYKITNLINDKIYIGSSINITNRWKVHINSLKANTHTNNYLNNSFNKYGFENFKFERIERVKDRDLLLEREQFYLDKFKPFADTEKGYNICKIAHSMLGTKRNDKTKKKMSDVWKMSIARRKFIDKTFIKHSFKKGHDTWNKGIKVKQVTGKDNGFSKTVYQYNFDTGKLIQEWGSANLILKELGITLQFIRNNCKLISNKKGEIIAFKDFIWSYNKIEDIETYKHNNNIIKKYKYLGTTGLKIRGKARKK